MNKSFIFAERISTNNLNLKKMAYVISDDCIACGTCIDECPVEAISEGDIYSCLLYTSPSPRDTR